MRTRIREILHSPGAFRVAGVLNVLLLLAIAALAVPLTVATAQQVAHTFALDLPSTLSVAHAAIGYTDIAGMATADVQETFKRVYLMAVDAIPDATPLTAQLNRTKKFKAAADSLYFNVKLETGGKVANVGDSKLLPNASKPKRKQGRAGLAHTYTVVAVGGQSIPLTDDSKNAFVANLEDQLEDGMIRVKNDLERQYNGDGRGILCYVETIGGAPTYGAQYPYGLVYAGGATTIPGTMNLIEGMDVAHLNPAGPTERGRNTIQSIDTSADTYTLSAAIGGTVIGDYVVLCNDTAATGSDQANNYGAEATGILAVCASGDTFENISGATYRRWNATIVDGAGGRPNERKLATLRSRIKTKCGEETDLDYTTEGLAIEMMDQLAALRRTSGETRKLKGGYEGLNINGKATLTGPYCPKGYWFMLNTGKDKVGMIDAGKMGYVDLDGAKLHRIEGRHAYRADLWFAHNAIWFQRNCHGAFKDFADDYTILR